MLDNERVSNVGRVGRWEVLMVFMIFSDVGKEVKVFDVESTTFVEEVVNAFGRGLDKFYDFEIVGKVEVGNAGFEAF